VRDRTVLVLAAAVLLGAVLRFATLGHQSLDEDETVSVWLMHHSLVGLLRDIPRTESTPPLFYLLEWPWTRLFGTSAVGMRSLSALVGVVTIPVCWLAGRELGSRRAGAAAAILAALSPALIWYSEEARAYALLILFSVATVPFLARALRSAPGSDRRAVAWWSACATLAMMSNYFGGFVVAPEALCLLLARRSVRRADAIAAVALVTATALALLPLALRQAANGGSDWIGETPLWGRLTDVPAQITLGEGRPLLSWSFATVVAVPLMLPALWVLVRGPGRERRAIALPAVIGLAAVGLAVLIDAAGRHILLDRNTLGAGAVLLVACAVGMGSSRSGRFGVAALAAVAVLFAWDVALGLTNPSMQREPWRDAARGLGQASLARAIVFGPNVSNPSPAPPLIPFQAVYLPSMLTFPDRGYAVREIDELDVRDDLSDTSQRPDPVAPGRDWRLVARLGNRTWTLYRYMAARPHFYTADQLFAKNLLSNRDPGDQLIGLQLPGPGPG
jgi:mannosyltransferase